MDIPVRLKFFRKLELFQEIKKEDKKAEGTKRKIWEMEKAILVFAATEHHHLDSYIERDNIKDILHKKDFSTDMINDLDRVLGNLGMRGYADTNDRTGDTINKIKILPEGLAMGEVLNETKNFWGKFLYNFFIYITWVFIIAVILTVLYKIAEIISPLLIHFIQK